MSEATKTRWLVTQKFWKTEIMNEKETGRREYGVIKRPVKQKRLETSGFKMPEQRAYLLFLSPALIYFSFLKKNHPQTIGEAGKQRHSFHL